MEGQLIDDTIQVKQLWLLIQLWAQLCNTELEHNEQGSSGLRRISLSIVPLTGTGIECFYGDSLEIKVDEQLWKWFFWNFP